MKFQIHAQLFLYFILISGCTAPAPRIFPPPSASITYDVGNGYYESLAIDYWEPSVDICFSLNIIDAYPYSDWLPVATLILYDKEEKTNFRLFLTPTEENKLILMTDLNFQDSEANSAIPLRDNLEFGKSYSFKYSFIDNNKIDIKLFNRKVTFEIPFNPEKLVLSASGVKAHMTYSTHECFLM
ncbi:hypothetical protein [Microbulbifer agarilyticus]|uniref:hypothetical protein n=1 Tax=Microbulbifer agarilyticus TaxID=260552 RepID=UPI001CD1B91E|nr:hypothetical protein [Microbulbifer agarilyticus]MCA0894600.1 hypothetical protein [Microbulbifer agarilyticus]